MSATPLLAEPELAPPPTARTLFFEFARMGLSGFGGVLPFVRRSVVERNRWLNDRDFVEILSLGQVLPGPNVINLALMLGLRFAGLRGAVAAFSGLVFVPMVVVLCAMGLYLRYQDVPQVRQMLSGMTAVAAGLVLSTGVKLAQSQPRSVRALVIGVAAFLAIGWLRWPLLPVMAVLVPVALVLEYRAMRKGA
ncbi:MULTISPECIES: chromate transporter [unclassified Cupriavidus]|uniref:chromate transporter n=1 Tax=unclassified Cupriavidus TaxID=2640874 RepID=UPI001C003B0B|nr:MULTISPECIES: chromate transporter [unclassified Cupriavidus]MCA3192636.1 chromate transporter [Cupriavidus sp.]MCA3194837.1 chromate transporter [Cupriavidus sp.]MCA3200475.1 chromate transporter [Cupriavidus sp.]MCA3209176.1 chromate transporter [Cupriavidus sp.]MCA3231597.1 chromate transporter [Cupriavidus sp.]